MGTLLININLFFKEELLMNIKKIFLLFVFVANLISLHAARAVEIPELRNPVLISLGWNCEPAWYLRAFHIRKIAFPFDWMATVNFDGLCKVIAEDFKDFLNPAYLEYRKTAIHNTLYNVQFYHDFPTDTSLAVSLDHENYGTIAANYLDALSVVQAKYKTRIERFITTLKGSDPVIFFRTHASPKQAKKLSDIIHAKYPNLSYLLVIVHDRKDFDFDWELPNVVNFYTTGKDPKNKWADAAEWRKVFTALGLIKASQTMSNVKYVYPTGLDRSMLQ